jgi:hypothetical protein
LNGLAVPFVLADSRLLNIQKADKLFFHLFQNIFERLRQLFASIFCSVLGVRGHVRAFKAATCRRTPNQKSSGTLIRSILKLFTVFTKAGRGDF